MVVGDGDVCSPRTNAYEHEEVPKSPVEVEVDIANGLAAFSIVGLPDTAVNEAKDRVRAAIKNSGLLFPFKRITVNLAPAELPKEGTAVKLILEVPEGK